ncbi:MAG: toprim domain-containing protein [Solirubrobacteraceae bacterium]
MTLDVIAANEIGWNGAFVVLPMRDGTGEIVAFKRRVPRSATKTLSVGGGGRPWPLYPAVPDAGWVLLVAGEFDALAARSAGLPGVSVTLGAGQPREGKRKASAGPGSSWWRDEWTADLRGRQVVVCFDNNETDQAKTCVRRLRRGGIRAQRLDLRSLGLNTPKGDLNDYLTGGGDPAAVRPRRLVRRRRSAA